MGVWAMMAVGFCLFTCLAITLFIKIKNKIWKTSLLKQNIFEDMKKSKQEYTLTISMIRNCFNQSYLTTSFDINLQNETAQIIFRPLKNNEMDKLSLTLFLENLSEETRHKWYSSSYDTTKATEMCNDVVNNPEILCMVATHKKRIIGVFEFSFARNEIYEERFKTQQGIEINIETDVRYAPCIADDYHRLGIGTKAFEYMKHIGYLLGKRRIIVWGGVLTTNISAIKYYEKIGFKRLNQFKDTQDGADCFDLIMEI